MPAEPAGRQEAAATASCGMVAAIAKAGFPEQSSESAIGLLQQIMKLSWTGARRFQQTSTQQQGPGNRVEHNKPDAEGSISEDDDEMADPALESLQVSESNEEPSTVGGHCAPGQ